MNIAIAVVTGIVLAFLLSFGAVKLAASGSQSSVTKPLYNYGTR
jgi:ABC-type spermidine/putrescine transport system permease subunit II